VDGQLADQGGQALVVGGGAAVGRRARPTAVIGQISQPGGPCYGIEASNDGLVSFGGGLPITDEHGRVIGAIGVTGGDVQQDPLVAEACLALV
jgi:uncharacterized protein GlcG (DUF336 family)